jgi:hypothetical protein
MCSKISGSSGRFRALRMETVGIFAKREIYSPSKMPGNVCEGEDRIDLAQKHWGIIFKPTRA